MSMESKRKRKEQKRFILKLEKEIKILERKLKHTKLYNMKIKSIRNFKISLRFSQLIAPYVVCVTLIASLSKIIGLGLPFYRDSIEQSLNTMKEIDNDGNIRTESKYDDFEEETNYLYYYKSWNKTEKEGTYQRVIETYELNDISEDEVLKLLNSDISSVKDVLGEPQNSVIETSNNVANEDLIDKDYFKAIIYDENEENYVVVKEKVEDNIGASFLNVLLMVLGSFGIYVVRDGLSNFDFSDSVDDLVSKYQDLDTNLLRKELKIKTKNYKRLTR